jgi:hypothetical protein
MGRTDVTAYALILHVISMCIARCVCAMRTLTRLFAAGAGIVRARAADEYAPGIYLKVLGTSRMFR